jgi:hypothetical protein
LGVDLSFSEVCELVAAVAAVPTLVYTALAYHRPKERDMLPVDSTAAAASVPVQEYRWIPIACTAIVILALGSSFVDRRFFSHQVQAESSLGPDNARIDLTPQPLWKDDTKSFYMNFRIINGGKNAARQHFHFGLGMATPAPVDRDLIDALFNMLRNKFKKGGLEIPNSEVFPGEADQFFSVPDIIPGMQFGTDENYQAAKGGRILIYTFVLFRYRDPTLPENKFLYTERCVYLGNERSIHQCDNGHNRSYISD